MSDDWDFPAFDAFRNGQITSKIINTYLIIASSLRGSSVVQDKLNKSRRFRNKSVDFDDNLLCAENPRLIYINDSRRANDKYGFSGNEIRTSKYTLIMFLPKNLFIQFHRVAYLYFLAIATFNQLPPLAVFGRTVSLFPLLFVLCVTVIKDGYEDWRRHWSDRNENNREALVLQLGEFQMKKWKKIRAGQVVKTHADETIPCDMVLLGTSDPTGLAYIQTMNLDGESNLKTRYARQETASLVFEGCNILGLIGSEEHELDNRRGGLRWAGNKSNAKQCSFSFRAKQVNGTTLKHQNLHSHRLGQDHTNGADSLLYELDPRDP
ncbi:phospholipid-transporting ATPase 1-like [Durio zibethinus]|uniref:Phospholipid-transporting ATPase 1-like n=1 Tax=Durio zibethinus TaxID=66656 RepID=A0A6P5Z575_DURZI|nr:phospholipid-transporting ATPase 1-like [Durio zibethinus]